MLRFMTVVLGMCLVLTGVGCAKGMQPLNLRVAPDPALKERGSLRVHLVGVQGDDELARFQAKPVGEWFTESDPLRGGFEGRYHQMLFDADNFEAQTLPASHPIWKTWKANNAMHLVVLVNMRATGGQVAPSADPRKRVIPLDAKRWKGVREVRVDIKESGIFVNPPPKSE